MDSLNSSNRVHSHGSKWNRPSITRKKRLNHVTGEDIPASQFELPDEIKDWTKDHVRQWILKLADVDNECANILHGQDINGASLLLLEKSELQDLGIKLGPAKLIIHKRDELVKLKAEQLSSIGNQSARSCKPYPFNRYHDAYRYKAKSILDVTESGTFDFIEPCHEYKAYSHLEAKMNTFTDDVIRFAAACMNSRTNGTIHFGVGDSPNFTHGEILGVSVQDKEAYVKKLPHAIKGHFEHKHIEEAQKCIKPPRFVEVLNPDMTSSEKYVIEVDIEPSFVICNESLYHVYNADSRKAKKKYKGKESKDDVKDNCKLFFIRDSSSTRNLLALTTQSKPLEEYNRHVGNITQLSQRRKEAEEKHLTVVKSSVQGSRLCEMLTGGTRSLDKSHFERYVMVTNKSHPIQLESLAFLLDMNLTAVLDFDPESAENGLNKFFEDRITNVHLPMQYKITEAVEEIASKLKLTRSTSWVFCNGGVNGETASDIDEWLTEKGSSVRDVISLLCRKDVLPHKKFLVMFLLLSDVNDNKDPLLETFSTFVQELKGTYQILCICENQRSFTYWKDLIEARYGVNISKRCIYELSFAEVNGTVLSLWSDNRRSSRFLPCGGGSKVLLTKKMEGCLDTLSILCVNQCEGGNEDKTSLEESFYKGGKVSWWNFYFSEQPGSVPFIRRDKFDYIIETILPDMCSLRKPCVLFNILHVPGCGGTTLAMHVLWALKDRFRCAVLRDRPVDYADVANQVVQLLTYETTEQSTRLPVLLMIDDLDEMDAAYDLQHHIEKECLKRNICSRSPQVILLNCMRTESWEQTAATEDTVYIRNELSATEQIHFQKKLEEIEKTYKNTDTFYGFMILKKNFSPEYIKGVVKNTLKSFNIKHKHAQLIAVMVLLGFYNKNAKLSVPLCEEFLGLQTKPNYESCKVEDGFEKFSTLLTRCTVEAKVVFKAVRVIHSSMAEHCLEELTTTYNVSKAEITNLLLTTDMFYDCIQGKDQLWQDVHSMLVKRRNSQFSPLIQAIAQETPGFEETVLLNAGKRFKKNAVISQLLARYHYLEKKDFREAKEWARKAKDLSRDSSYISDTFAQVIKYELINAIANDKEDPVKPEKLREHLKSALSATEAFKETQAIAKKEGFFRVQWKRDSSYNTAGCLGEMHVAVIVMDILEKIPVFSADKVSRRNLIQILSGKIKIRDVSKADKMRHRHASYYHVLQEFEDFLQNLKDNMKRHFDFLDNFYVNLGPRFSQKDTRGERTRQQLFKYFQRYVDLFCNAAELMKMKHLSTMLKIQKAQLVLEGNKADTHSGLLECLSNSTPASTMEKIVEQYDFIVTNKQPFCVRDNINLVYASVILSHVKPESQLKRTYDNLLKVLFSVLECPIPHNENLALHFMSVVMLWPEHTHMLPGGFSEKLGSFVSQMRSTFSNDMTFVWTGKTPVVHFYLGKKQGYDRLISQDDINQCISQDQDITSQWKNGKIWKHEKVVQLLRRVTGEVSTDVILADTPIPDLKIEVNPVYKSQLWGGGNRVTFFVGFSMNGPLAFDIEFS